MKKMVSFLLSFCLVLSIGIGAFATTDPFTISMITPLTGPSTFGGQEYKNGAELALKHIEGAINGREIKMEIADGPEAQTTMSEFERLYNVGSRVFLSGYGNAADKTFSAMADDMEVLYFSLNWAQDLTEDESDYFFRVGAAVTDFLNAVIDNAIYVGETYLNKSAEELKVAIVYMTDISYMAQYVEGYAKEKGVSIVLNEGVARDATDFVPIVTKLMEAEYDIFVPIQTEADGTNFQKTMFELNYKPQVTLGAGIYYDLPVFADLGNDITDGVLSVSFPVPYMSEEAVQGIKKFKEDYEAEFGYTPLTHALQAYGCMQVIFKTLEQVDPSQWEDTAALATALRELDVEYGELAWLWGVDFDEMNNNTRADKFIIGQWINGEYLCVGPENLKTTEPIIPFTK